MPSDLERKAARGMASMPVSSISAMADGFAPTAPVPVEAWRSNATDLPPGAQHLLVSRHAAAVQQPQPVFHAGMLEARGAGAFSAGADEPPQVYAGAFHIPAAERPRSAADNIYFLAQVVSAEQTARRALEEVEAQRKNDTALRDLLLDLIDGLHRLVLALQEAVEANPNQPVFLGKTAVIVNDLREKLLRWWEKNGDEAFDYWFMRLPALTGFTALLHSAGADMSFATPAVTAAVLLGPDGVKEGVKAAVKHWTKQD